MSVRQALSLFVIAVVVLLQFGVPAIQLLGDGPQRWGWQMYSRTPQSPAMTIVRSDQSEVNQNLSPLLLRHRYELRFDQTFADQLCARNSTIERVRLTSRFSGDTVVYECNG